MSTLLLLLALSLLALTLSRAIRREQALAIEVASLGDRVRELSTRVEAAEADVAHAITQTEIAETLLVEKGVADEEDIEDARRRFNGTDDLPPPEAEDYPGRGELN